MERRFYFFAGDVLSNGLMGIVVACLATSIVDSTWHMFVAMPVGMVAGMVLSLILMPVFVGLFGAMEVMLPVMLTAMVSGMVFGMASATQELTALKILLGGGLIGTVVLFLTYAADAGIRGKSL